MPADLVAKLEPKKGNPSFRGVLRNLLIYYVLCSCLNGRTTPRRSPRPIGASDRRFFGKKTKTERAAAKSPNRESNGSTKMNGPVDGSDERHLVPTISAKVDADERDSDPKNLKNLPFIDSEDAANLKYILPDRLGFEEPVNLHIPAALLSEPRPLPEIEAPDHRDHKFDRDPLFFSETKILLRNEINRIENNLSKTIETNENRSPLKIERSGSSVKSLDFLPVLESLKRNEEEIEQVRKSYYEKTAEKESNEMRDEPPLSEISVFDGASTEPRKEDGCADRFRDRPNSDQLRQSPDAGPVERRPGKSGSVVVVTTIIQSPTVTLTEVTKQFSDTWKEYEITSRRRSSEFGGSAAPSEPGPDDDDALRDLRITVQSERGDPKQLTEESARVVCQPRDARIAEEYLTNLSHMLVDDCRRFHENDAPDSVYEAGPCSARGQIFNDLSVNIFEEDRDTNVGSSYNASLVSAPKSADSSNQMIIHLKSVETKSICDRPYPRILKTVEGDSLEKDFYSAAFKTAESPVATEDINDRRSREAAAFAQKFFAV